MENLEVYRGRPADCRGRTDKEKRVYDLLDGLGVEYWRVDHEPAMTMEVCAQIDRAFGRMTLSRFCENPDGNAQEHAIICKNLFLCNRQCTRFYLLMIPGEKKFLTKNLSSQINSARLSFGSAENMERLLDLTPGSASVLGLMNDHDNSVQLLIDRDVLQSDFFGCHPCINTSSLKMRVSDLMDRILPAIHHSPVIVTL